MIYEVTITVSVEYVNEVEADSEQEAVNISKDEFNQYHVSDYVVHEVISVE